MLLFPPQTHKIAVLTTLDKTTGTPALCTPRHSDNARNWPFSASFVRTTCDCLFIEHDIHRCKLAFCFCWRDDFVFLQSFVAIMSQTHVAGSASGIQCLKRWRLRLPKFLYKGPDRQTDRPAEMTNTCTNALWLMSNVFVLWSFHKYMQKTNNLPSIKNMLVLQIMMQCAEKRKHYCFHILDQNRKMTILLKTTAINLTDLNIESLYCIISVYLKKLSW